MLIIFDKTNYRVVFNTSDYLNGLTTMIANSALVDNGTYFAIDKIYSDATDIVYYKNSTVGDVTIDKTVEGLGGLQKAGYYYDIYGDIKKIGEIRRFEAYREASGAIVFKDTTISINNLPLPTDTFYFVGDYSEEQTEVEFSNYFELEYTNSTNEYKLTYNKSV